MTENKIYKLYPTVPPVFSQADIDAKVAQTRSATLKEVGEWLKKRNRKVACFDGAISRGFAITEADIDKLLKGEMPEG